MYRPSYSQHLETLMAVVTHLAVHKWALRQPQGIANDLSIDVKEVAAVLKDFKGLFRESKGTSSDRGAHFYSLHLRHARQIIDPESKQERPPLEHEYLIPLLSFVWKKASEESQGGTAIKVAIMTAGLSLAASLASIVFTALHVH